MNKRKIFGQSKVFFSLFALMLVLMGSGCVSSINTNSQTPSPNNTSVLTGSNSKEKLDLSGQGLTQVSQDIFKQTSIVELDLSNNLLTGSLPAEIRYLNKLEVLNASDNAMTGLPAEIGQLSNLKMLDLSNNQLTGLPLELGQLLGLEVLDLRGNNYSTYDLELIRKNLPNTNILTD